MRFLHTSDWHIGRTVRGQSRLSEQEAALQQVLTHVREQQVDCLLVAGDVFDTSAPAPESEALVYTFFRELYGAGVPAVVIAGNHDHPHRWDALAPLLSTLRIHAAGSPADTRDEALWELESRDGERALVAALPWINERAVVRFAELQSEPSAPLLRYAERVERALDGLAGMLRPDLVSVLVAHLFVDDAKVGAGGGERELHINQQIYGVRREGLPAAAQYIALGHVHKRQTIRSSPRADYCGSLLQLDFGERDQAKFVNLVEVHAGLPAQVTPLPITAGRQLVDVGSALRGVVLNELAAHRDDNAWLRVYVEVDMPVANLPQLVRELLPTAVHIERARRDEGTALSDDGERERLGPVELFERFYAGSLGRGHEATPETLALFRRLLDEESHAAAEA